MLRITTILGLCTVGVLIAQKLRSRSRKRGFPLPPGPKGKPIIKNLLDFPAEQQWLAATKWAKEFGNIVYINIVGQPIIFINDLESTIELFEKRSSNYSDRIQTTMMRLMGTDKVIAFTPYGPKWRLGRRVLHQEFNSTTAHKYQANQLKYVHCLVTLLKDDPAAYEHHMKYFASGLILESVYGFHIKPANDPLVEIVGRGIKILEGLIAGQYLVDAFPLLRYFPHWMPGAGIVGTKSATYSRQGLEETFKVPFEQSCDAFHQGTARASSVTSWLSKISNTPEGDEKQREITAIRDAAATAFMGGFETTSSSLLNFLYLMVENPEAQRKAQAELDEVVGRGRVPDFADKEQLPYLVALYKEFHRLFPLGPLGAPHGTVEDDVYNGMLIPKGTILFSNIWAIAHDEKEYGPDVDTFRPERFLEADLLDPSLYSFGFGRRICPGRFLAENSLFIGFAFMLHLFTMERSLDKDGNEIPPNPSWVYGLATHVSPFPCSIKLRFPGAEELINSCS